MKIVLPTKTDIQRLYDLDCQYTDFCQNIRKDLYWYFKENDKYPVYWIKSEKPREKALSCSCHGYKSEYALDNTVGVRPVIEFEKNIDSEFYYGEYPQKIIPKKERYYYDKLYYLGQYQETGRIFYKKHKEIIINFKKIIILNKDEDNIYIEVSPVKWIRCDKYRAISEKILFPCSYCSGSGDFENVVWRLKDFEREITSDIDKDLSSISSTRKSVIDNYNELLMESNRLISEQKALLKKQEQKLLTLMERQQQILQTLEEYSYFVSEGIPVEENNLKQI